MMSDYPVLYSFRRCPYAMRARLAVWASGCVVELREVVLRDKPQAMLKASPKGTVPVLILPDGRVIDESLDVMIWALQQSDPDRWLGPDLDDMTTLIRKNDTDFKKNLDRYKYAERYHDADPIKEREKAESFLHVLEERLFRYCFLCGDKRSLADYAIFPFIRQFAFTDKGWFDTAPYPKVQNWLEGHLNSDLFKNAMRKYPQWQEGDARVLFP